MIQTADDDRRTMLDRPSSVVLSSACCSGKPRGSTPPPTGRQALGSEGAFPADRSRRLDPAEIAGVL